MMMVMMPMGVVLWRTAGNVLRRTDGVVVRWAAWNMLRRKVGLVVRRVSQMVGQIDNMRGWPPLMMLRLIRRITMIRRWVPARHLFFVS